MPQDFNRYFMKVQSTLSSKIRAVNFYVRMYPPCPSFEILTSTFEDSDAAEAAFFYNSDIWHAAASYMREEAGGPWMLTALFDHGTN